MFTIWAKTVKDGRKTNELTYKKDEVFNINNLHTYLSDICKELDIETPIILKKHVLGFYNFNKAKFLPEDFTDSVNFDNFTIENI